MNCSRRLRAAVAAARVSSLTTAALVAGALFAPKPALAADPREDAKALTKRAGTEFKLAHFQAALDLYTQAYERFPIPALLFNLGQCNKNLGNNERALFFFQGYLRDKPDAPNRPAVQILVADLTKQVADAKAAQAATDAEHRKLDELAAEKAVADARAAEDVAHSAPPPLAPAPPPPVPMHRNTALTVAGAAGAGVGLVLLGTGLYFGLHANSEASQLSTGGGTWSAHDQSLYSNGQSSAHVATGLYVAGGVLFAGGAAVALLGWQKRPDGPAVTAGVTPTACGTSAFVAGRF